MNDTQYYKNRFIFYLKTHRKKVRVFGINILAKINEHLDIGIKEHLIE